MTSLQVALVGCGTQRHHGPALKALEREGVLHLIAAYDPDPLALETLCSAFPDAWPASGLETLLAVLPDLVIIASPPRDHAEQAIAALDAGIDVHCEKPLATNLADGERMVAAAAAVGRRLSVGLLRRHFPASQAIGRLIASGAIGPLDSIDVFEGGPVRSGDDCEQNAGVLQDIGTHCLDLLGWWLGSPSSLAYEDDAMGGVEANCRITLSFGDTQATVRLSRDWAQPNRTIIKGRDGWLGWTANETSHFDYGMVGSSYAGHFALHEAITAAGRPALGAPAPGFDALFVDQLRRLITGDHVAAADTLQTLGLIDRCHAARRPMPMPWMEPG